MAAAGNTRSWKGPAGFHGTGSARTNRRSLRNATLSTWRVSERLGGRMFSTGNLTTDNRVALILVDYPGQERLKIRGTAQIFEGEQAREWMDRLREPSYKASVERAFVIRVEAFDWNCPQHITPRFTAEQIQEALAPFERRMQDLEQENKRLQEALAASDTELLSV